MTPCSPFVNWRRMMLASTLLAVLLLALFYALALRDTPAVQAQGTVVLDITKKLQGSNTVRVGDYLTFTIRITNNGTITTGVLPLIDTYDATILRFERSSPDAYSNVITGSAGTLFWNDLTTSLGDLPPHRTVNVTTVFRAIAPKEATVNAARIGDALDVEGKEMKGDDSRFDVPTAVGGQAPLHKALAMGKTTPQSGMPISFTIAISNDGAADITRLPLRDVYSTTCLLFWKSVPPPSSINAATGVITWDNVLPGMGLSRLRPNQVITITTVFTALKSIDGAVVNRALAFGVQDEFQNEVAAPRQTDVPIRILPGPNEVQPTATARPRERKPRPTATPTLGVVAPEAITATVGVTATTGVTATAGVTATVGVTATAGVTTTTTVPRKGPRRLPGTGGPGIPVEWVLVGFVLLVGGIYVLAYRRKLNQ